MNIPSIAPACRRAVITSLARAAAAYQPSSYEYAINLATTLVAIYDAEMQVAADAFDTASYEALRALRAATMQDLVTRAASLAHVTTVTTPSPMPALAYRLYRDASRADDLIARNDPIHPAFMPVWLEALTS